MHLGKLLRHAYVPRFVNRKRLKFVENQMTRHNTNPESPYYGRKGAKRLINEVRRGERGRILMLMLSQDDNSFDLMTMSRRKKEDGRIYRMHLVVSWDEPTFFLNQFETLAPRRMP